MIKRIRTIWKRPSILATLLLPMTLLLGSESSGSPLDPLPRPSALSVAASSSGVRLAARSTPASSVDPLLGASLYLQRIPFGDTIVAVGERHGLDPLLIASVAEAESSFRVDAISPKGALGLMQVMPFHVADGVEPFDPETNLELGAALLSDLTARYDGELPLALAAYHAGPGAIERFGGLPPYRSTHRYIERVLEIYLEHYSQLAGAI